MTRYQLVLRDPEGELDHTFIVDHPKSGGFIYRGQALREDALIEVASGAIYLVVEKIEEDGLTRFICEPL